MKLFNITEVGSTIAYYDNQSDEGAMDASAVQAINAAVDALGDDLAPEKILAWVRMRYDRNDLGFHQAVQRIIDKESNTAPAEENEDPDDTDWDAHWAREDGDDERADDLEADAEFARQDAGDEEEEDVSVKTTQIGDHTIELLGSGRDNSPFGNNPIAIIKFDGTKYEVYKQGMINIWAFPKRTQLSSAESREFDEWMNNNWKDEK